MLMLEQDFQKFHDKIQIDYELVSLIPPLTEDEYNNLEFNILHEGCRRPIILWNNIIIDGHDQYKICTEYNINFSVEFRNFVSRDEAIFWIIQNQISCRDLTEFQRIEMVYKCKEVLKSQISPEILSEAKNISKKTHVSLSKCILSIIADVSPFIWKFAVVVLEKAPELILDALRKNELNIRRVYYITQLSEDCQKKIVELIEHGEPAIKAITKIKAQEKDRQKMVKFQTSLFSELFNFSCEDGKIIKQEYSLETYFAVFDEINLGSEVNRIVSIYKHINEEFLQNDGKHEWVMTSEEEQTILQRFCEKNPDVSIIIDDNLYIVRVRETCECREKFEEFTRENLCEYQNYAVSAIISPSRKLQLNKLLSIPQYKNWQRDFEEFLENDIINRLAYDEEVPSGYEVRENYFDCEYVHLDDVGIIRYDEDNLPKSAPAQCEKNFWDSVFRAFDVKEGTADEVYKTLTLYLTPDYIFSSLSRINKRLLQHAHEQRFGLKIDIKKTWKKYKIISVSSEWENTNELYNSECSSVERIALPGTILLLWCSPNRLNDALTLMNRWYFHYKNVRFILLEKNIPSKICLLGVYAENVLRENEEQGFILPKDMTITDIRNMVQKIYGYLPAIELFSETPSEDWDVWMPD